MREVRKPRGDARLKTLPEGEQAALWEYLREHTIEAAVEWLRGRGVRTSRGSVSEFYAWYGVREVLRANESTVAALLEDLKRARPDISAEALQEAGQMFFSSLAIRQQDAAAWTRVQQVGLKREEVRLARERFEALQRQAQQAQAAEQVTRDGGLSAEEKLARYRQIFGAS